MHLNLHHSPVKWVAFVIFKFIFIKHNEWIILDFQYGDPQNLSYTENKATKNQHMNEINLSIEAIHHRRWFIHLTEENGQCLRTVLTSLHPHLALISRFLSSLPKPALCYQRMGLSVNSSIWSTQKLYSSLWMHKLAPGPSWLVIKNYHLIKSDKIKFRDLAKLNTGSESMAAITPYSGSCLRSQQVSPLWHLFVLCHPIFQSEVMLTSVSILL